MSAGFVDFSAKADVTPAILKQQLEDATDQDKSINVRKGDAIAGVANLAPFGHTSSKRVY